MRATRLLLRGALAVALITTSTACSWFGGDANATKSESVFEVQPGQCFVAPKDVKAELSDLARVTCTNAHTQEAYAIVKYTGAGATGGASSAAGPTGAYPGGDVLKNFADGACAQRYTSYVGVDYLDSSLFFTYLLPSARSWEQDDDRSVICFVTTTGAELHSSVKGSRR